MIFPMPLDEMIAHLAPTGERLVDGEAMTEDDRVTGSFACAVVLWLWVNDPDGLRDIVDKISAEMEATEKLQ